MYDRRPPVPPAWLRAVRFATASPDAAEALPRLLAEAAAAVGAQAGAVVEGTPPLLRATWEVGAEELAPLLGDEGVVGRVLVRQAEWLEEVLPLSRAAGEVGWAEPYHHLLLIPLRSRGLPVGAMVLLYGAEAAPAPEDCDAASVFGGLGALVLDNERLYEEARQAQQARDHFLTALNHEMRTPATAFVLLADLLGTEAAGTLPPRVERLIRDATVHVTQLVDVLRRVLDLGKLGGASEPERADIVQPREKVLELMRRLEPSAKRKNVALALYTPRTLPPLQTDAGRFARILMQLLSNAIKYTAEGTVEVRLERAVQRLGRGRAEPVLAVRVRDTGRGIPQEELQRIFEPFAQVDEGARTDSRTRGLGLGLPLARQLARGVGGEVAVESTPGSGTVATLYLPYHQEAHGG